MIAFPVSPRVTICAASLTAPRFAEMLPAGIEPAGIEPAGIEPAGMSASVLGWSALCELSTPGLESSIAMLPAGMLPAGFGWIVGADGLFTTRSRSVPPGTFRYAATFVPGASPVSGNL